MKLSVRSLLTFLCILAASCVNHDIPMQSTDDSFVFGRYFGYCAGDCYDAFVLRGNSLYQSENETYPSKGSPWTLPQLKSMDQAQKNIANELRGLIPQSLLDSNETLIGCPDCGDFGAVYIELNYSGKKRFWYLGYMAEDPDIKNFVITVHKKIDLIIK
jgi:hypothetical protein